MFSANKLRSDFPIFQRKIRSKPIIYLDSVATSLKPQSVIEAVNKYYREYSANVFRGIYSLSEQATQMYERTREKVAQFINAYSVQEIIFTRNTTESINLVVYSWGRNNIQQSDEIVVTIMEHHSNFVPWQQKFFRNLKIWKIAKNYSLDTTELNTLITRKTKLLTITAVSNVLGTINPIKEIIQKVKSINSSCLVLVDAAQAVPHMPVDVRDWGADFVVFSSHKMLGPTGVGVLWAKEDILRSMSPFLYGGEMVQEVHLEKTFFKEAPHKFEAGTPDIAGVIGLGEAIDYLQTIGMENIRQHEKELVRYALEKLTTLEGLTIYGPQDPEIKAGVIAFTLQDIHGHDIAEVLDEDNICIRSGHHCAMPLHEYLGISATARASFYLYTAKEDIDALLEGIIKVKKVFNV